MINKLIRLVQIPPNDWSLKNCLIFCGSILALTLFLTLLNLIEVSIPVLQQIAGFILLTFVPGILLLKVFKIHELNIVESLLYILGLSLFFDISVGILINFTLPPLGFSRPLNTFSITIGITLFIILIGFVAFLRDRKFEPSYTKFENIDRPGTRLLYKLNPYLIALILPLVAILGTSTINYYNSNVLIFVLILLVSLIIVLTVFNKLIPESTYPFLLFSIALALILQTTLISSDLVGSDIHLEYALARLVINNGYWDYSLPYTITSCLSVVILAPLYSLIMNTTLVWVFKAMYPLIFSLLPLALFRVFRIQMNARYSFFSTLFFITVPMFFMDMPQLVRQQIAEIYFGLIILLMVERKLPVVTKTILICLFSMGVIFSHYGLGTGYIGYLLIGLVFILILKSRWGIAAWQWVVRKRENLPSDLFEKGMLNKKALIVISSFSIVFMLWYYSITASGTALSGINYGVQVFTGLYKLMMHTSIPPLEVAATGSLITTIGENMAIFQSRLEKLGNLISVGTEPLSRIALGLDFWRVSLSGQIWRIFQYLVELSLIIGVILLVLRPNAIGKKLKIEYIALSFASATILLSVFILPTGGWAMGSVRIWQITLMLMSPLVIKGGEAIGYGLVKLIQVLKRSTGQIKLNFTGYNILWFPVLAIVLPYFIFNSGAIFEITKNATISYIDTPYSIALSNYRTAISTAFNRQDVAAADWLLGFNDDEYVIVSDYQGAKLINHYLLTLDRFKAFAIYPYPNSEPIFFSDNCSSSSYIFLGGWNTDKEKIIAGNQYGGRTYFQFNEIPGLEQLLKSGDLIYSSGKSRIIYKAKSLF